VFVKETRESAPNTRGEPQQSPSRAPAEPQQSHSRATAEPQQSHSRATAETQQSHSSDAAETQQGHEPQQSHSRATAEPQQSHSNSTAAGSSAQHGHPTVQQAREGHAGGGVALGNAVLGEDGVHILQENDAVGRCVPQQVRQPAVVQVLSTTVAKRPPSHAHFLSLHTPSSRRSPTHTPSPPPNKRSRLAPGQIRRSGAQKRKHTAAQPRRKRTHATASCAYKTAAKKKYKTALRRAVGTHPRSQREDAQVQAQRAGQRGAEGGLAAPANATQGDGEGRGARSFPTRGTLHTHPHPQTHTATRQQTHARPVSLPSPPPDSQLGNAAGNAQPHHTAAPAAPKPLRSATYPGGP
jgi:hypothetical protein